MSRHIKPTDVLNIGLNPQGAPQLMVNDVRLAATESVAISADTLVRWVIGLLAISADALAEAGEARRRERVN